MTKIFLNDLGIRTDNLKTAIIPYFVLTAFFLLGSILVLNLIGDLLFPLWNKLYPSILILIFLAFLQELVFRSFLIPQLKSRVKSMFLVVLLDATIFAIAHIVFPFSHILVPGAFVVGLGFAYVYYYYPNLFLA